MGGLGSCSCKSPELVSDEVQVTEGDPPIWLHFLHVIAKVEDDSYFKHNISLHAKGLYLARKLLDDLAPVMPSNYFA